MSVPVTDAATGDRNEDAGTHARWRARLAVPAEPGLPPVAHSRMASGANRLLGFRIVLTGSQRRSDTERAPRSADSHSSPMTLPAVDCPC
jgi:hypothetical protein